MFEIIGEIIVSLLAQYPGAAIRWAIFRKKPFKKYLLDDASWNLLAVVITVVAFFLFVQIILELR